MKFEVGDRVRLVSVTPFVKQHLSLGIGDIGTVIEVNTVEIQVQWDEVQIPIYMWEHELEPLEPAVTQGELMPLHKELATITQLVPVSCLCDECGADIPVNEYGHQALQVDMHGNYGTPWDTIMSVPNMYLCTDCVDVLKAIFPNLWERFEELGSS